MLSMPKGCGLCEKARGELPAWEWKDKFIHLKCFLEFQQFIANTLSRSPSMIGAPKRSNETCLYSPSAMELQDVGRTLKYTLCDSLVVKTEAVDDEKYLEAVKHNNEMIHGPIHPTCLIICLKAEVLRLYDYGGR